VIVSGVSGEARLDRQRSDSSTESIEFSAIDESKARTAGGQPAEETDESGTEECDANTDAHRNAPTSDKLAP